MAARGRTTNYRVGGTSEDNDHTGHFSSATSPLFDRLSQRSAETPVIANGILYLVQSFISASTLFYLPLGPELFDDPIHRLEWAALILVGLRFGQLIAGQRPVIGMPTAARPGRDTKTDLIIAGGITIIGTFVLHTVAVLFGAHIFAQFWGTWFGSLFVALLAVTPAARVLGMNWDSWVRVMISQSPENIEEQAVCYPLVLAIIGAWTGGYLLPLDWDRPWQVWPIPSVLNAWAGHTLGGMISLVLLALRKGINTERRRLDD